MYAISFQSIRDFLDDCLTYSRFYDEQFRLGLNPFLESETSRDGVRRYILHYRSSDSLVSTVECIHFGVSFLKNSFLGCPYEHRQSFFDV